MPTRVLLRAGRRRGDFLGGVVRRGSRDSLYLGNASAEAKAAHPVHLGKAAPAGPSKTSLASCRPHRSSLAFKLNKTTTNPLLRIHCGILFLIRHITTTHFSHKDTQNLFVSFVYLRLPGHRSLATSLCEATCARGITFGAAACRRFSQNHVRRQRCRHRLMIER